MHPFLARLWILLGTSRQSMHTQLGYHSSPANGGGFFSQVALQPRVRREIFRNFAAKPARPRLCRRVFFTKEHIVLVFGNNFMRSHHFARWKTASLLIIPQDQRSVSFWKRMRLETIIHNAENISLEESEHIRSVWPVPRPHRLQLTTTKIREKRI